ncbi:MAG TPA: tetratricopeptide repeat protein [Polyangiaceae bacterium]
MSGCSRSTAGPTPPDASKPLALDAATAVRTLDSGLVAAIKVREQSISEGRRLFRAKDYAGAVTAFGQATEASPNDADAWSELGWAAFNAGDLERAEEATRKSLARTGTNNVRGATLYNLGRIDEQRNRRDAAVTDYEASLRARPNGVVLERLRALDRAKAQQFALLSTTACTGPFKSVADFCAQLPAGDDGKRPLCVPGKGPFVRMEGPRLPHVVSTAPYLSVAIQSTFDPATDGASIADPGPGVETFYLLVQTTSGYFVSPSLMEIDNPGAFGISQSGAVRRFTLEDVVPGGAPEIVVEFEHDGMDQNMGGEEWDSENAQLLMVCGLGASGRVRCTLPTLFAIEVAHGFDPSLPEEERATIDPPYDKSYALEYAFTPPGKVTFSPAKPRTAPLVPVPEEVKALLGVRPLSFP